MLRKGLFVTGMTAWLRKLWSLVERVVPMGPFARSVAVVGGGTGVGYALVLAASPIITRLYLPPDFGVLGVYISLVSMGLVVISWRYESAIPAPEEDGSAANVLALVLALVVGMSTLIAVVLWVLGDVVLLWLDAPRLRPYLWLVPFNTLVGGIYGAFQLWSVRKKAFAAIAQSKLSQAVGAVTTQIGLGLLYLGPLGLLLGHVVRWGGGGAALIRIFWRDHFACLKQVSVPRVLEEARRYRRFPMFTSWSALLNTCSAQLPVMLLSAFFGTAPVGLYVLTSQVLWTPLNFIGQAISQVFFSNAAEASRQGQTAGITLRVFTGLAGVGTPYAALLMITAPEVFSLVFGPKWMMAGVYAQFLCPWLLVVFTVAPLSSLVYVLERQQGDLIFQACLLAGRVGALLVGGLWDDPLLAIALFGAVSVALWFVYMLWLLRISGNEPREGLVRLARNLAATLPIVLPAAAAKLFLGGPIWVAVGLAISGTWATVGVAHRLRKERRA
ncbi:MAG: oligosaccharide flippase family protein [Phycisphaerae bacterium]